MSQQIIRKPIRISWIAPNGKHYEDIINMSINEYQNFVNGLLGLKNTNQHGSNELCNENFISKHGVKAICNKLKGHQDRNPESSHSGDAVNDKTLAQKSHGENQS